MAKDLRLIINYNRWNQQELDLINYNRKYQGLKPIFNQYLDDIELDVMATADISPKIFKQRFDVNDFGETKGDYTLSLKLPRTKRNELALKFLGEVNSADSFFQQDRYKARIEGDGNLLLSGFLFILDYTQDYYDATVIGSNVSYSQLIGEKNLTELNMTPVLYSGARGSNRIPWVENESDTTAIHEIFLTNEEDNLYQFNAPLIGYGNFFIQSPFSLDACSYDSGQNIIGFNFTVGDVNVYNQLKVGMKVLGPGISNFAVITSLDDPLPGQFKISVPVFGPITIPLTHFADQTLTIYYSHPDVPGAFAGEIGGPVFGNLIGMDFDNALAPNNNYYDWSDFRFCPYVKSVLKQIFTDINYQIAGDFIQDPKFDNLIIPFTRESDTFTYKFLNQYGKLDEYENGIWGNILNDLKIDLSFGIPSGLLLGFQNKNLKTYGINQWKNTSANFPVSYYNIVMYDVQSSGLVVNTDYNYGYNDFVYTKPEDVTHSYKTLNLASNKNGTHRLQFSADYTLLGFGDALLQTYNVIFFVYKTQDDISSINDPDIDDYVINGTIPATVPNPFNNPVPEINIDPSVTTNFNLMGFQRFDAVTAYDVSIGGTPQMNVNLDFTFNVGFEDNVYVMCAFETVIGTGAFADVALNSMFFESLSIQYDSIDNLQYPRSRETIPSNFLPDVTQIEFVKGVLNLFNLKFTVDELKRIVYINTFSNSYLPNDTAVDWTDKTLEIQRKGSPVNMPRTLVLDYVDDEDYYVRPKIKYNYKRVSKSRYFTTEVDVDQLFAGTSNKYYNYYLNGFSVLIPTLGTIDDYNIVQNDAANYNTSFTIRILRWLGMGLINKQDLAFVNPSDIDFVGLIINSNDIRESYDSSGMGFYYGKSFIPLSRFDFDNINPSLPLFLKSQFNPVTSSLGIYETQYNPPFRFNFFGDNGLFDNFFAGEINMLERSELINIPIMLNDFDIMNMDLRKPVQIDQNFYFINTVEGYDSIANEPTTCSLIKRN